MNYAITKKASLDAVETAREAYLKRLTKTEAFKALKASLEEFEEKAGSKPYDDLWLDESGYLVCKTRIYLDRELCTDEEGNGDVLLASEILQSANESLHYTQDDYSQGYFEWTAEICFGEPCIVNYPPERNCYAVYCNELSLKIDRIASESHGLMLVEQAVRKMGASPLDRIHWKGWRLFSAFHPQRNPPSLGCGA